jgi:hypothetical protein
LMLCGGLDPDGIRSIFMMGGPLASQGHENHPWIKAGIAPHGAADLAHPKQGRAS